MKCAVHPDVDATGYCRHCGKPLCPQCTRDVRGALYCEECLSGIVFGGPGTTAGPGKLTTTSPGAALVLGFVPGLGAVYNGEYVKALIHVCIFGGIIAGLNSDIPGSYDALLAIALACFYFYMPIDAYRVAKAREGGQPVPEPFPLVGADGKLPLGPIILIGLGVLLLFANFGLFRWDLFGRLWPIVLIALGAWILFGRTRQTP
ncbi:MAG TPA: B-box zinc finger protein [Candidatus Acidoferrales bacterium]